MTRAREDVAVRSFVMLLVFLMLLVAAAVIFALLGCWNVIFRGFGE